MALLIPPAVFKQLTAMLPDEAKRLLDRLEQIAAAPAMRHPNVTAPGRRAWVVPCASR